MQFVLDIVSLNFQSLILTISMYNGILTQYVRYKSGSPPVEGEGECVPRNRTILPLLGKKD